MLDEFKEEEIVNKVGGRFKLSALIQKRLVALNRGARPLVETQTNDPMEIVVKEIMHDKIYLDTSTGKAYYAVDATTLKEIDGGDVAMTPTEVDAAVAAAK